MRKVVFIALWISASLILAFSIWIAMCALWAPPEALFWTERQSWQWQRLCIYGRLVVGGFPTTALILGYYGVLPGTGKETEPVEAQRFAALAFLPVLGVHLCLAPFWLYHVHKESWGDWFPGLAIFVTALIIPIYFAFLGCHVVFRRICVRPSFASIILPAGLMLNVFLNYSLWGISSGMFFSPDEGTLVVVGAEGLVGFSILATSMTIATGIRQISQSSNIRA